MARLPIMTISDAAAERLKVLSGQGLLKVGVKKGGCAGLEYDLSRVETPAQFDEVVEDKGVKVVVDAKAVLYLIGAKMDYKSDKFSSQFTFINPNETASCGCGESINITPALPEKLHVH
jgi:iron-sulfur cluster assembly protein